MVLRKQNSRDFGGKVRHPGRAKRNLLRIIGGTLRSRLIEFPDSYGLRPTGDRIRETLFNWLGQSLSGMRCLDLFTGSGALGFEAASRGAARVVMVEMQRTAWQSLRESASLLGLDASANCRLSVLHADARVFVKQCDEKFDIVFLDPPFKDNLLNGALAHLPPLLDEKALVYVEAESDFSGLPEGWLIIKQSRAGHVHFGLLSFQQGAP